MHAYLDTAGERLAIECSLPWVTELIAEAREWRAQGVRRRWARRSPCGSRRIDSPSTRAGGTCSRAEPALRAGELVVENACTAGFDLHLRCTPDRAVFTYRWRPPARDRSSSSDLAVAIPSSCKRDPHSISRPLVGRDAGPSSAARVGVRGRSRDAAHNCSEWRRSFHPRSWRSCGAGGRATGDNLGVGDGSTLWGYSSRSGSRAGTDAGCRMGATRSRSRTASRRLVPDSVIVLERGDTPTTPPSPLAVLKPQRARWLRARTWPASYGGTGLAAMLAQATGLGPAHPPVLEVAAAFAGKLPRFSLALGRGIGLPPVRASAGRRGRCVSVTT
mgnify:CR=1 FL=1